MRIEFKRPNWLKRSRSILIDGRSLSVAKRTKSSFLAPRSMKLETSPDSDGAVDDDFKAEVEVLLRENAELLRRLAL